MERLRQWVLAIAVAGLALAALTHVVATGIPQARAVTAPGVKCETFKALLSSKRAENVEEWMGDQITEGRTRFVNTTPGTYGDTILCAW